DASVSELDGSDPADAPEALDRQRVQKTQLTVRRDGEQPVGFGNAARHLGQEFGPGHADGDRKPYPITDLVAQPSGDVHRRTNDPGQSADIQEGFVDGDSFDEGRGVFEDREYRLAGFGIRRHAWRHDDCVGAQSARRRSAPRWAGPESLRPVTGGKNPAAADDHRSAPQAWIVTLLDRCVERVEIG